MEEEKEQQQIKKSIGDKLKHGAKEQGKNAGKKVFKKIITALAPILLKLLIIVLVVVVLVEAVDALIDSITSSNSKDANGGSVQYSYVSSGVQSSIPQNGYSINVTLDPEHGGYKMNYLFYDKDGNVIKEETAISNIKDELEKANLDVTTFSEAELKTLAVLVQNGLKIDGYTEEQLKCLQMFIKAEIAGQNFDLRTGDNLGKEVNAEDMLESDFIYGTLQATRTSIIDNGTKYSTVPLQYIELEEFENLVNNKDINAIINRFSINEKGELLIARWSSNTATVEYKNENDETINVEDVPEEYRTEADSFIDITYKPIAYKSIINKYLLNYGVLSDLLITTQNQAFCLELCNLAFNSKIVINLKEELIHTDSNSISTYVDTQLTRKYVQYEIQGQTSSSTTRNIQISRGSGYPTVDAVGHGWDGTWTYQSPSGSLLKCEYIYQHEKYKLEARDTGGGSYTWILYKEQTTTNSESVNIDPPQYEYNYGDLIVNGEVTDEGEEPREIIKYTTKEEKAYVVNVETHSDRNNYDIEVSQIDCWFAKLTKEYNDPISEETPFNDASEDKGRFADKEEVIIASTENSIVAGNEGTIKLEVSEIDNDSDVKAFIRNKENSDEYSAYKPVTCTVTSLTKGIREKIATKFESYSETTRYKFGEEVANTSEIKLKNIDIVGDTYKYNNTSDKNSFLSIYDKYLESGEDLYLEQDAETNLFELLESDTSTEIYSNLIKGLLYAYDGIDRGDVDFSGLLRIFKLNEFKTISSSRRGLAAYLQQFGGKEPDLEAEYEGKTYYFYKMYSDNDGSGVGNPTIGMGDIKYSSHHTDFNASGYMYDKETNKVILVDNVEEKINELLGGFEARKTKDEMNSLNIYVEKNFIDSIADQLFEHYYNSVVSQTAGLDLSAQQLYALTYLRHARGNIIQGKGFVTVYQEALAKFEKDSWQMNKYIWDNYWYQSFNTEYIAKYQGNLKGSDAAFETYVKGTIDFGGKVSGRNPLMFYTKEQLASWGITRDTSRPTANEEELFTYEEKKIIGLANWDGDTYESDYFTFPVYNQFDARWGSVQYGRYSDKTISSSGCGCCSMAAILSGYLGEAITPDVLAEYLNSIYPNRDFYTYGVGSNSNLWSNKVVNEFGCSLKGAGGRANALKALQEGYCVLGGETGHVLAYVPASSSDRAQGYIFRIIDSARGHNYLCRNFEEADRYVSGSADVKVIIYPTLEH